MIEKILIEINRLKNELDGYSAREALDYIESYINTHQPGDIDRLTDIIYQQGIEKGKDEMRDALLEWAMAHKSAIEINGEENDAYTRGEYRVILALIDKLNSL